ncbi:MAG: secondary thiamine-phosphate synthase enzyme YjbQ [Chloroflexota bacterium]
MEAPVAGNIGCVSHRIFIQTSRPRDFIDITNEVESAIRASGVRDGMALISSQHTTAAVIVNEHEPELLKDLDSLLTRLAPSDHPYAHNAAPCGPGENPNGHSHCQALLLSSSATLPISNGELGLGRYQRLFLVELDNARPRTVVLTLLGQ